jgi:hypothetical protein
MAVQYDASPPMSDRLLSPIWRHLHNCLESRSTLTAEDHLFQQILTELLATSSPIAQHQQEDRALRLIIGDKLKLPYYWIRQWGIQDPATIDDLVQDSWLYFMQITLPKFSPTGASVVGCCRTYFGFAVQATVSNHFRKQKSGQIMSLDDQLDWQEFAEQPQTSDLREMLAAELQDTKNQWLGLVKTGNSELLDFGHADCPGCTVGDVLWRLGFKRPPDTLKGVAKAHGMKYHQFYPFYKRHVLPRAQALLLAPNLLNEDQATMMREEIDLDVDGVLQKPINTKMPQMTVQFVAQQHLWIYSDPPLDFAVIAKLGQEQFGYKKLTAEMLADFWWRKCQQPLAQMVGVIFG